MHTSLGFSAQLVRSVAAVLRLTSGAPRFADACWPFRTTCIDRGQKEWPLERAQASLKRCALGAASYRCDN
eukprot:scaffold25478_cov101-Isochrysis_galbana.AAC.6